MRILIVSDYEEMSERAAQIVKEQIEKKPDSVLGLATGSSPVGVYQRLIDFHRQGLDFSRVRTFNLDEYRGLGPDHPASYRYFMQVHLFSKINIPPEKINIPDGLAVDAARECAEYDRRIEQSGGIDLQILGVGRNGHIGFNEPGTEFGIGTHETTLTENTRQANARFFNNNIDEVPRRAISMGIKTIMRSRRILLLACGREKAEAIYGAVKGPVTRELPASILQLHPDVTFIIDQMAASRLTSSDI